MLHLQRSRRGDEEPLRRPAINSLFKHAGSACMPSGVCILLGSSLTREHQGGCRSTRQCLRAGSHLLSGTCTGPHLWPRTECRTPCLASSVQEVPLLGEESLREAAGHGGDWRSRADVHSGALGEEGVPRRSRDCPPAGWARDVTHFDLGVRCPPALTSPQASCTWFMF